MGRKVTGRELAEIIGVTPASITNWNREGMPVEFSGTTRQGNQYDTADCIQWLLDRARAAGERESARERLDRVRADREELALARDLEQVAPAAEFEALWIRHIGAARATLLGSVDQLIEELEERYQIQVERSLLERPVFAALTQLQGTADAA